MNPDQQKQHGQLRREFETLGAKTTEELARVLGSVAILRAEVSKLRADLGAEHTHRLDLAKEQRAYVDAEIAKHHRRLLYIQQHTEEFTRRGWRARLRWMFTGT